MTPYDQMTEFGPHKTAAGYDQHDFDGETARVHTLLVLPLLTPKMKMVTYILRSTFMTSDRGDREQSRF